MVKIISFIIFVCYLFVNQAYAQDFSYGYLVEFTDKSNTVYSTDAPQVFLAERAIQRRIKHNIPITEQDFPVNRNYTDSLKYFDATLHVSSRWFNSAVYFTNDSCFVAYALNCSFVDTVTLVYQNYSFKNASINNKWNITYDSTYYGSSFNQIAMCNGQLFHKRGLQGQGMQIAVLDGGFYMVNELSAFDSIFVNNQILATYDFVDGNENVYNDATHGMSVLSTMCGYVKGQLVGTAPQASYYLYRTENGSTEYPIEEENWIAGAEAADSAGADIITASLGYSTYDNSAMSYTYEQMDGKSTRITQAAEVAFTKGIFLVNSAGNEGYSSWHYITAPSDGEHVLCIGAVDANEKIASFSSRGPSADGRVKPDVCAKGYLTTILNSSNKVVAGNGTSFSGPVMAGLVACLWQVFPEYSNTELLNLVRRCGKQYNNPDDTYGYGIPDFSKALFLIDSLNYTAGSDEKLVNVYPIPASNQLNFDLLVQSKQNVQVSLFNSQGCKVYHRTYNLDASTYNALSISNISNYEWGMYILKVVTQRETFSQKVIIN